MQALTPTETLRAWGNRPCETLDAHAHVSWADMERDLSAWRGNPLQEAAFSGIYAMEQAVKSRKDPALTEIWRKLQTSDHFYYLCTKYWSDGDVHKYFSPYESPYEAYRRYSHALEDMRVTLASSQGMTVIAVTSAAPKAMAHAAKSKAKSKTKTKSKPKKRTAAPKRRKSVTRRSSR
jgi:alpha-amylase